MCTRTRTSRVENTGVGKGVLVPRGWLFQDRVLGERGSKETVFGSKEQGIRRTQGRGKWFPGRLQGPEAERGCWESENRGEAWDPRQGLWTLFCQHRSFWRLRSHEEFSGCGTEAHWRWGRDAAQ